MAGARVWYDEWTIRPGDSLPGAIDQGLSRFDTFALVWTESAAKSRWVKVEREVAMARWIGDPTIRVVPIVLDDTPLPTILQSIRYVNGVDGDHLRVARELLGIQIRGFVPNRSATVHR